MKVGSGLYARSAARNLFSWEAQEAKATPLPVSGHPLSPEVEGEGEEGFLFLSVNNGGDVGQEAAQISLAALRLQKLDDRAVRFPCSSTPQGKSFILESGDIPTTPNTESRPGDLVP